MGLLVGALRWCQPVSAGDALSARGGACGDPLTKCAVEKRVARELIGGADAVDDDAKSGGAHGLLRDGGGGEEGAVEERFSPGIETGEGDVGGDADAAVEQAAGDCVGGVVGGADPGAGAAVEFFDDLIDGGGPGVVGAVVGFEIGGGDVDDAAGVVVEIELAEGVDVTGKAGAGPGEFAAAAEEADAGVAEGVEVGDEVVNGLRVIHADDIDGKAGIFVLERDARKTFGQFFDDMVRPAEDQNECFHGALAHDGGLVVGDEDAVAVGGVDVVEDEGGVDGGGDGAQADHEGIAGAPFVVGGVEEDAGEVVLCGGAGLLGGVAWEAVAELAGGFEDFDADFGADAGAVAEGA
jgi:hypothetical protein